jgi:hypothetical protein
MNVCVSEISRFRPTVLDLDVSSPLDIPSQIAVIKKVAVYRVLAVYIYIYIYEPNVAVKGV